MKSDIIEIDNCGRGFEGAITETQKAAAYHELDRRESMHLQLCTEEMLCMVRSITGEMQAKFWIESDEKNYELHMSTKTVLDKEKRGILIGASTSRKNEAAHSFLGRLRDAFEEAMAKEPSEGDEIPVDVLPDLSNRVIEEPEWDGYEVSILKKVADQIKVGIRGGAVELVVCKHF